MTPQIDSQQRNWSQNVQTATRCHQRACFYRNNTFEI